MEQIDREMVAAVEKHGPVTLPDMTHIDEFYDRIDKNKQKLANA